MAKTSYQITMQDEATKVLREIAEGLKAVQEHTKALADIEGIEFLKKVLDSASGAVKKVVADFSEAETAAKRLDMTAQMRGMDGAAQRFTTLSGAVQNLTGKSAELVQQMAAEMMMQGKSEAMINKTIKAASDLSAVTGDDLSTSIEMLNWTLSGQRKALAKNIPAIKDMTAEQLKAGAAIDLVAEMYAGSAESMSGSSEVAFARMDETVRDLSESFGAVLAPAAVLAANTITFMAGVAIKVVDTFNAAPAPIKMVAVAVGALTIAGIAYNAVMKSEIIQTGVTNALKVATITKDGVLTAATWTKVAAQTAYNAVVAVQNPLLWAGIAAASAATVVGIAYAASQANGAAATNDLGNAASEAEARLQGLASAVDGASTAYDALHSAQVKTSQSMSAISARSSLGLDTADELKDKISTIKDVIKATEDWMIAEYQAQEARKKNSSRDNAVEMQNYTQKINGAKKALKEYQGQLEDLEKQQESAKAEEDRLKKVAKAQEDARKALEDYREAWNKAYKEQQARSQKDAGSKDLALTEDDYAVVDLDFEMKRIEAIKKGIGTLKDGVWTSTVPENAKIIQEMTAQWQAARAQVAASELARISDVQTQALEYGASLTESKLDDIELQYQAELKENRAKLQSTEQFEANKKAIEDKYRKLKEKATDDEMNLSGPKKQIDETIQSLNEQYLALTMTEAEFEKYKDVALEAAFAGNDEYLAKIQRMKDLRTAVQKLTEAANIMAKFDPVAGALRNYESFMARLEELRNSDLISEKAYLEAKKQAWQDYQATVQSATTESDAGVKKFLKDLMDSSTDVGKAYAAVSEGLNQVFSIVSNMNSILMSQEEARYNQLMDDYDSQLEALENTYNSQVALAEALGEDTTGIEEEYQLRKDAMEEEQNAKKIEYQKKVFENEKAMSLLQAGISTATGVISAIARVELWPYNFILGGLVAAAGATQMAAIASSQFTPQLAEGAIINPTPGGTMVNVGEAGWPEAVIPLKEGWNRLGLGSGGQARVFQFNGPVYGNETRLVEKVSRAEKRLQKLGRI